MGRMQHLGFGVFVLLAVVVSAVSAQAAARVATIEVKGMVWSSWQASVAAALERLPGVQKVEVSLEKAQARVQFDDAKTTPDKMMAVIEQLGFRAKLLDVKPPS